MDNFKDFNINQKSIEKNQLEIDFGDDYININIEKEREEDIKKQKKEIISKYNLSDEISNTLGFHTEKGWCVVPDLLNKLYTLNEYLKDRENIDLLVIDKKIEKGIIKNEEINKEIDNISILNKTIDEQNNEQENKEEIEKRKNTSWMSRYNNY